MDKNYYDLTLDDGISGDDVNRHLRERRLGFAEPSKDWANCNQEIRCIWPEQIIKDGHTLTGDLHVHSRPAYWAPEVHDSDLKLLLEIV